MIGDLFDSPWKILIVALVIIVLFGSKKLPFAARSLGQSATIRGHSGCRTLGVNQLVLNGPLDAFYLRVKVALIMGAILSSPSQARLGSGRPSTAGWCGRHGAADGVPRLERRRGSDGDACRTTGTDSAAP